jgi:Kef-type K+ transport system membrane component KefB
LRSQLLALTPLAKFAIAIAVFVGVPPHVLGVFGEERPIADFFSELGKLLLMFSTGLEIDVGLFRKAQTRASIFGLVTTMVPLGLGTLCGLAFGYPVIPAIVVGSLLASHTLLGLSIDRAAHELGEVSPCAALRPLSHGRWADAAALCLRL